MGCKAVVYRIRPFFCQHISKLNVRLSVLIRLWNNIPLGMFLLNSKRFCNFSPLKNFYPYTFISEKDCAHLCKLIIFCTTLLSFKNSSGLANIMKLNLLIWRGHRYPKLFYCSKCWYVLVLKTSWPKTIFLLYSSVLEYE